MEERSRFRDYMAALASAMRQELPEMTDTRAEFTIDDVPYVFTADGSFVFAYAVVAALPDDEGAKAQMFSQLLHSQFCFCECSGFSFGVDADDSFVLLQSLLDTNHYNEFDFVEVTDIFVKTANVWSKRLAQASESETKPRAMPELFNPGFRV